MQISRVITVIFSLMHMLGIVWYIDSITTLTFISGVIVVFCALVISLTPQQLSSVANVRIILLTLSAFGIGALSLLIVKDYQQTYGPDLGAITMRLIFVCSIFSIGLEIFQNKIK